MKRLVMLIVLLLASSVAWAQSEGPVEIGVITSLTGRFAEFGEQHQAGFAVALEDINAAGGINGREVVLNIQDDTSEVSVALTAAQQLIDAGVPLVMGAYSSSITNPLAQFFTRSERPFLVYTSSADNITMPGSEWVFRLNQPANAYSQVLFDLFDYLNEQGADIEKIAVIAGNGNFEQAVATAAEEQAADRGYEIVANESYDRGVTDFRPVLNRFRSQEPDVVFMVSYAEDSVAIMRQANEVGLDADLFAGAAAGFALPGFITDAGPAAEYVVTATAWTEDVVYEGAAELFERLTEELGGVEPSYHAAQAYAGLITAVDALSRAESFSPEDVQAALEATNIEETPYGPIRFEDFDGYQNQNPILMVAQQVQDGQFVTVFPGEELAENLIFPTPAWSER
ncbi:MAG TPA: ABC transporter substrate-binding protein [Trueperaceae bacterium]